MNLLRMLFILPNALRVLLVCLFVPVSFAQAEPNVRVEGLFSGAAVLIIDGQQILLKEGKRHDSGVKLVHADSRKAVIEIDGKEHELALHMAIGGAFQEPQSAQVSIRKNDFNQYKVAGSINRLPVTFLVDTGATTVAMNEQHARQLGLQYKLDGTPSQVVTASGVAESWHLVLDTVKVGEISVSNVGAVVVKGDFPQDVLLGMTYLQYVKLSEHNSVLLLEQKF